MIGVWVYTWEAGSRIGHCSVGKDGSGYHIVMIMKWK
jgi:hypothetical protein